MHVEMARRNARSNVSVRAAGLWAGSRVLSEQLAPGWLRLTDICLRRRPDLIRRAISLSANAIYFGLLLPPMDGLLMTSRRG
jgi:hypothetical protein